MLEVREIRNSLAYLIKRSLFLKEEVKAKGGTWQVLYLDYVAKMLEDVQLNIPRQRQRRNK